MLERARELTTAQNVRFENAAIEDIKAAEGSFDVVLSSLALHYIKELGPVFSKVADILTTEGVFCYSVEHPVFTSREQQDWYYQEKSIEHWPVDDYFLEGPRTTQFLSAGVVKYHRTIESHFSALVAAGFKVEALVEPRPSQALIDQMGWQDELRRPMMLIIKAVKV